MLGDFKRVGVLLDKGFLATPTNPKSNNSSNTYPWS